MLDIQWSLSAPEVTCTLYLTVILARGILLVRNSQVTCVDDLTCHKHLVVCWRVSKHVVSYLSRDCFYVAVVVTVDTRPIRLQLCDTAGQVNSTLTPLLCYPDAEWITSFVDTIWWFLCCFQRLCVWQRGIRRISFSVCHVYVLFQTIWRSLLGYVNLVYEYKSCFLAVIIATCFVFNHFFLGI